jgi:flagellar biosynthetic protein FlhB
MSQQDDSAEKVHDPTPRKLDQARRKGELPRSADLNHAAGYAGLLAALVVFGAGGITSFGSGLMTLLDRPAELAARSMQGGGPLLGGIVMHSLSGLIPWFAGPALAVLAVIAAQRGFVVAPDKIKPRMSRIGQSPTPGTSMAGRVFSSSSRASSSSASIPPVWGSS